MGIDINAVQFLIAARKKGVCFDHTLMLGRHSLNVFTRTMTAVLKRNGLASEKFLAAGSECAYAGPLFESQETGSQRDYLKWPALNRTLRQQCLKTCPGISYE